LLAEDEAFAERARNFSARVRDVSQQLEIAGQQLQDVTKQLEPAKIGNSAAGTERTVTYDASCHLLYGQGAGEAALKLLSEVPELKFAPLEGAERCCGGAGIYNLLEPDLSAEVLAEKLANIRATGAKVLATGNPGCQMQIGAGALLAGMDLIVCHPVELLDEAYARAGLYDDLDAS
jgi:glycolate oxidase iron-sulfur subunit